MALVLADRVRDTTTTTGTGTVTLSGTAPTGYQNFSAIGNGNTTYYTINGGSEWEVGIGTYSSTGPTLARTTVLASSNSGSLVNFSAGTKDVFVTYPAEKSIADGYGLLPVANGGTGATSLTSGYLVKGNGTSAVSASVVYDDGTNVGIGTSSPLSKATISQSGTVKLSLESQGSWNAGVGADASGNLLFYNPLATERMRINTGGGVVIGGTATYAGLTINNPDNTKPVFYFTSNTNGSYPTALATTGSIDNNFSGGAGEVSFWNNQTTAVTAFVFRQQTGASARTDIMTLLSSGDVGIGTSSPQSRLHIDAPFGAGSFFTGVGNNNSNYPPAVFGLNIGYNFQAGAADVDFFNSWTGATGAQGGFSFRRQTGASSQTSLMRIDGSGNVGIGTSSPIGASGYGWLTINGSTNSAQSFSGGGTEGFRLQYVAGTAMYLNTIASIPMLFQTNNTERMRIDSSGNVGIGTSSPGQKLDVNGSAAANNFLLNSTAGTLGFSDNSSNVIMFNGTGAFGITNAMVFKTNNAERMWITSGGDVGIGTSSPSYRLHVVGGTSGQYKASGDNMAFQGSTSDTSNNYLRLQNTTGYFDFTLGNASCTINNAVNGPTVFNTNSTERMRLTSTGVLGLGIAGGDASLHIVGIRGGNGRMTQTSTGGTSQNNLNLIASSSAGGADQWFSYGVATDNYFFIQNGVGTGYSGLVVASNNRVGIGISTPSGPLDVRASAGTTAIINSYNDSTTGNVASVFSNLQSNANSTSSYHYAGVTQGVNIWYLYGNGTSSWSSDQRLKKNIESTRDGYLDDLCRLRVVKYNWHTDAEDKPRELGLIAQEVEEVFPGLVEDALHTIDETETKYKVLKGSVLPYMLLKALQEANAKIDALTARVAQLEGN